MEITQNALPFGLHEKTSEGLSAKKSYASPNIKVVEFAVEGGFQSSDPNAGRKLVITSQHRLDQVVDPNYEPTQWGYIGSNANDDSWF